jgi:DNA invertase Pin-like site-specific DNA recombinase
MMRAVCYARVSSAAQRERDTIASQLRVLPEFVAKQAWSLAMPVGTYVDDGRTAKSGQLEHRLGLAKLLRDAAAKLFDVVVVVDIDRLTRAEDLAERGAILGALQAAGVRIASATSGQVLDLSTSTGDLFTTLHAFFAADHLR